MIMKGLSLILQDALALLLERSYITVVLANIIKTCVQLQKHKH